MKCKYMAFAFVLFGGRAAAGEEWHTQVDLVTVATTAAPGQTLWVGVRLRTADGWHVFWANPGEVGLTTKVQWLSPPDAATAPIRWPWPLRILSDGWVAHTLPEDATLWTPLRLADAVPMGAGWTVRARVEWLECRESCQAGSAEPSLFVVTDPRAPQADPPVPPEEKAEPCRVRRVGKKNWELIFAPERGGQSNVPVVFFPRSLGWAASAPAAPRVSDEFRVLSIGRPPGAPPKRLQGLLLGPAGWRGPGRSRGAWVDVPMPETYD
ncbi:MAG TPA: protein-disulfide reductase DsbD family protein [Elusimicrobiota bacterium]|nr:protein-disulfide reductase DsbD family protein [Elusimicrobiota bacterium]